MLTALALLTGPTLLGVGKIVLILIVAGVLLWAIMAMPAIDATIKQVIKIIVIVVVVIWVVYIIAGWFGLT